mmetsp:Transcript_11700/g.18566  ORF Transcript_11700/g.18566 Transcript_11700/m.18566 type:complete len:232 (-) Transcript_11700:963-1658(-)
MSHRLVERRRLELPSGLGKLGLPLELISRGLHLRIEHRLGVKGSRRDVGEGESSWRFRRPDLVVVSRRPNELHEMILGVWVENLDGLLLSLHLNFAKRGELEIVLVDMPRGSIAYHPSSFSKRVLHQPRGQIDSVSEDRVLPSDVVSDDSTESNTGGHPDGGIEVFRLPKLGANLHCSEQRAQGIILMGQGWETEDSNKSRAFVVHEKLVDGAFVLVDYHLHGRENSMNPI